MSLIFDRFSRAHAELLIAMRARNRPSFLDWLLGGESLTCKVVASPASNCGLTPALGNYESFAWHRARLLDIYEKDSPGYALFLISLPTFLRRQSSSTSKPHQISSFAKRPLNEIQAPNFIQREEARQELNGPKANVIQHQT